MKARHLCAVAGVAVAVAAFVFVRSLSATVDHQALAVAERLLVEVPIAESALVSGFSLDARPNGRVLQGPPVMVTAATSADPRVAKCGTCVVTRSLFAQRRLKLPSVGDEIDIIGRKGAYRLKVSAIMDWNRPLRGYPNLFLSEETARTINEDWHDFEKRTVDELALGFQTMEDRNMSRARPLLLWAAVLTALCLLVNTLFITIESRRKEIAILRMVGMCRLGVVKMVSLESFALSVMGLFFGVLFGLVALFAYVTAEVASFPMGMAISWKSLAVVAALTPLVAVLAALVAIRPALAVRPLEAASDRTPRKRHLGMLVSFSCGFGAFVAVEVWGASLMSAFVPSPEFPDAIVSILPAGVSAFDISKVQGKLNGVKRIHELQPLQVNFHPLVEMTGFKAAVPGKRGGKSYRNALLLASDYIPPFKFIAGERESALERVFSEDACLITDMMARARSLSLGDNLTLDLGRDETIVLKIVGILDLNWHMVTSRALVRGLNRMPPNTDGPVFVSFDTLAACDFRPQNLVKMTHLWLDYEDDFLKQHGILGASKIVEKEIEDVFHTEGNVVRTHARDEIADGTLSHGNDIVGAMARVPFVFIAVISLGFVAMLIASADSRKREFAVLRAVGATRLQLASVLTAEALKVSALGLLLGFVVGTPAGWLFTHATRAAMANWGIPPNLAISWLILAEGALGAVVFAIVIAVPSAMIIIRRKF